MTSPAALAEKKTAFGEKLEALKTSVLEAEDIDMVLPRARPYKTAVRFLENLKGEILAQQKKISDAFNELSTAKAEWQSSADAVAGDTEKTAAFPFFDMPKKLLKMQKGMQIQI